MYIKYKPTITDQLVQARLDAIMADREIDYIQLTRDEWGQLRSETQDYATYAHLLFNDEITISGVRVTRGNV